MIQIFALIVGVVFANPQFPIGPDPEMTPGSVCENSSIRRYKERIKYCPRSVSREAKRTLIIRYDRELGYSVGKMRRFDFKIDHYIPLCMGGSNEPNNLWPQHKSVYEVTDIMEQVACEKMAEGVLLQEHAIELIRKGKNDLESVTEVMKELNSL